MGDTYFLPNSFWRLSPDGQHDLGQADGLPRLGAGRVERHLQLQVALQQVELHRFDDEILHGKKLDKIS